MNKTNILRIFWTGALVWLVPFVISMGFFTPAGEPRVDIFLFKTVMLLVSTPLGMALMIFHLRRLPGNFVSGGLATGLGWLAINWGLDFLILLPLSKMSLADYGMQIGLRYLAMPMTGYFFGRAMETAALGRTIPG